MRRICTNSKCGAIAEENDCMDYKHPTGTMLCPICYDTTEEIPDDDVAVKLCKICHDVVDENQVDECGICNE